MRITDMVTILETLEAYKAYAENEHGLNVFAIALKGSQNYNLSDEDSDIDANLVFIPSPSQLRSGKTYKFEFDTGEVTCHNLYDFAAITAKGNPQWVEVCNTEYMLGDLLMFQHYKVNPSALKGMLMEKVHAFSKLYPSREKFVKEFGYDPKQLHHIIRLYDIIEKDVNVYTYSDEERARMMDIKRGRFPATVEQASALRDEYVEKLHAIYEDRKLKYEAQPVDYDMLDKIYLEHFCKGLK